ncbi:MAG TPA: hypothetical protein VE197_01010, partial [Mycobacterium sp.]|nr:hypothetical protein [Mycobacterium sp.]
MAAPARSGKTLEETAGHADSRRVPRSTTSHRPGRVSGLSGTADGKPPARPIRFGDVLAAVSAVEDGAGGPRRALEVIVAALGCASGALVESGSVRVRVGDSHFDDDVLVAVAAGRPAPRHSPHRYWLTA